VKSRLDGLEQLPEALRFHETAIEELRHVGQTRLFPPAR
jgi:hypothetical protein